MLNKAFGFCYCHCLRILSQPVLVHVLLPTSFAFFSLNVPYVSHISPHKNEHYDLLAKLFKYALGRK